MKAQHYWIAVRVRVRGLAFLSFACLAVLTGCGSGEELSGIQLEITTAPLEGATVKFNDTPVGETPVIIPNVTVGPALVEVELEGFHSEWETVHIEKSPAEQSVTVEMRPLEGEVTVECKPSPAQVRLDNDTILGDTPLIRAKIPAGIHTLQIEYENYITAELTFEVEADFRYKKAFQLTPKNATLRIFSIPSGAALWLNNRKQIQETPVVLDLLPGTYRVGVHAPGYVMKEQVVQLTANADDSIELRLLEGAVPEGMVLVPAGEFIMGFDDESPDERPQRTLMVEAYYIDKYEVTNEQYQAVVRTYQFKKGEENTPVAGVTWEQATAYARAIGKRLPTEIEWEKAARGEDGRTWPWGNHFVAGYCSHASGTGARLRDVGSFDEGISPYGCYDMAGNIQEWTQSWYQAYPGNKDVKAGYGQVYRVLRGGSYLTGSFDVRTVRRHYERMDLAEPDFGFRCAAEIGG